MGKAEATRILLAEPVAWAHSARVASMKWQDLPPRRRRIIVVAAAVDGGLRTAALIDLARRPGTQVRGRRSFWAVAITTINSLGVVPIVYFAYGRRRPK